MPGWVINRNSGEFGWQNPERTAVQAHPVTFGHGNVQGMLYAPKDAPKDAGLPTVIWLHSYSYPIGYMWVYRRDLHPVLAMVCGLLVAGTVHVVKATARPVITASTGGVGNPIVSTAEDILSALTAFLSSFR